MPTVATSPFETNFSGIEPPSLLTALGGGTASTPAPPDCTYCLGDPVCLAACEAAPVPAIPESGIPVFKVDVLAQQGGGLFWLLILLLILWASREAR